MDWRLQSITLGDFYVTQTGTGSVNEDWTDNEKAALEWWLKAGAKDLDLAQYSVSVCYETGFGGSVKDENLTLEWYNRAAAHGRQPVSLVRRSQ